jgi:asparagine synthase (glutamine-hydrolysing)
MCGIAGAVNWGDAASLARMTDVQTHRGPDDRGQWETTLGDGTWVGLGSRRLAIVDLSPAGHMPMQTPDGRYTLVYNGEIYNYPALRRRLEAAGYQFRSHSDTEAVLYLYAEMGPDCVRELNGMFSIALWDAQREQLFLARDHFGIKPFYYCHQGPRLAFASEVKGLLELPGMPRELDYTALNQYLSFLWVPDPLTMFRGIMKLPAGHYAIFRQGRLELTEYWDLKVPEAGHQFAGTEHDLAAELKRRFTDTVQSQLRSDVPLGAFLSAGVDSSCIVAAMADIIDKPVHTFTIAPTDKYQTGGAFLNDDQRVAARTAKHFGCQHTEIVTDPDVVDLLPKLIWHMDEPTSDPAILSCYLINREARPHVTVILAGNGGDELFAGYRKYVAHFLAQRYQSIPRTVRKQLLEPAAAALPSLRGTPLARYVHLVKKMARSGSLPPVDRFIQDSDYQQASLKQSLCTADTWRRFGGADPRERHLAHIGRVSHADFLNQMLYLDTKTFLVSLNLTYNDKMSMASSVEARVPYLDHELAQWVMSNVPPGLKLHGRSTKYLLRKSMEDRVPAEVFQQKKAGFGAPLDYWLANDLREMVDDLLGPEQLRRRGLFEPAMVERMLREHRSGRRDWCFQIWQLVTLEIWMRTFLDSAPRAA